MKIAVLGSGIVGKVLGAGFLKHGHQVMLGTRDPNKQEVRDWLRENPTAAAGTFDQAAKFGELVVLATLGRAALEAIDLAGPANLAGKTVMDTTNPIADGPPVQGAPKVSPQFGGWLRNSAALAEFRCLSPNCPGQNWLRSVTSR